MRDLRRLLLEHRHSALLAAIVMAIAVRPLIGNSGIVPIAFSLALLVLLLIALVNIKVDELVGERSVLLAQHRRRRRVGWTLAVLATAERLAITFFPSHFLFIVGSIGWLLLFAFVTWSELRTVLKAREVTAETISLSVAVYLLLGLTWSVFYVVIFQFEPQAFNFGSGGTPSGDDTSTFSTLVYFSLTTLATVGYGDITPVTLQARFAAVSEGIAGQFYLAILVARLVAMHLTRSMSAPNDPPGVTSTKTNAQGG